MRVVALGEVGKVKTVLDAPHRKMNARPVACTSNVRNAIRQTAAKTLVSKKINHMYESLSIDLATLFVLPEA